ncbi:MAG: hypothetical protein K8T89_24090 [Planctomycetes bacterium]|nr:hypothetical protein [Planctomycetota bacterium]
MDQAIESVALSKGIDCDDAEELRRLAEPLQGEEREPISLAVANFFAGKILCLNGNGYRARFFLIAAMSFVRTHCQSHDLSPDFLFRELPE